MRTKNIYLGLLFLVSFSLKTLVFAAPTPVPPSPRDSWLVLTLHDNRYACVYMDMKNNNIAMLYRGNEWSKYCVDVRYDEFSRFSVRNNGKEYCLTMPLSVTTGKETWDYLTFTPCVVGLYRQLWVQKEEDGKSYLVSSPDEWRILDYQWKLYISNNGATFFKHSLSKDRSGTKLMLNTPSRPMTYTIPLSLQWRYNNKIHDLFKVQLHYNPSTRQIINTQGQCLKSNLDATVKSVWSYTGFEECPEKCNSQFIWNINLTSESDSSAKYQLWDANGNMLAVTNYGSGSGYSFVASAMYVMKAKKDWLNTKFDSVTFFKDAFRQYQKNDAAGGDNCNLKPDQSRKLIRSPNPFNLLSQPWLRRWWEIARSNDGGTQDVGYCGVCMLHTMEMIAEFAVSRFTYSSLPPSTSTFMQINHPGQDPFTRLRTDYSRLNRQIQEIYDDILRQNAAELQALATQIITEEQSLSYFSTAMQRTISAFFPQLALETTSVLSPMESTDYWSDLHNRPVGTVWAVFYSIYTFETETEPFVMRRHSLLLYRGRDGFYVIPTNITQTYEQYSQYILRNRIINPDHFNQVLLQHVYLDPARENDFYGLVLTEVGHRIPAGAFSRSVSFRHCEGLGPGRRGNGNSTNAAELNACSAEGRCLLE